LILFYAVAVAAVFSLTYELQPAIIFMDEVDSFLGQLRTTDREFLLLKQAAFVRSSYTVTCNVFNVRFVKV